MTGYPEVHYNCTSVAVKMARNTSESDVCCRVFMCKLCPNMYMDPNEIFLHAWSEHRSLMLFVDSEKTNDVPLSIMWLHPEGVIMTKEEAILCTQPYVDCEMGALRDFKESELCTDDLSMDLSLLEELDVSDLDFLTPGELFSPESSDTDENILTRWHEWEQTKQTILEDDDGENSEPDKHYETEYTLWYQ